MKKNLISALIRWMLYFLTGCYTTTNLTWEDLNKYHKDETVTFVDRKNQSYALEKFTDSSDAVFYIESHPECLTCTQWALGIDSITLECSGINDVFGNSNKGYNTHNYELAAGELSEIKSSKFDYTSTILLGTGLFVGLLLIIAASSFDMGGSINFGGATFFGP